MKTTRTQEASSTALLHQL